MTIEARIPVLLESGDCLTRAEFHRRYCLRPDIKRAELISGVVYVSSPVRQGFHGRQHGMVTGWLTSFAARTPGLDVGDNSTVFLDPESEVQPDAFLFWDPPRGEGARMTDEGYIEGAPLFIVEVAASSASYDLHDKMEAYRRAGVPEYVVWRVFDGAIDWFPLQGDSYVRVAPDEQGLPEPKASTIESAVFPGLRLNVPAMLAGDRAAVLAVLAATP